jgi:hypothetical protein
MPPYASLDEAWGTRSRLIPDSSAHEEFRKRSFVEHEDKEQQPTLQPLEGSSRMPDQRVTDQLVRRYLGQVIEERGLHSAVGLLPPRLLMTLQASGASEVTRDSDDQSEKLLYIMVGVFALILLLDNY